MANTNQMLPALPDSARQRSVSAEARLLVELKDLQTLVELKGLQTLLELKELPTSVPPEDGV